MGNTIIAISNTVLFILARCSIRYGVLKKFRKFHRKTPVLESLFNRDAGVFL